MAPGVMGCLGKDQHDEMVKKMADVQIDVRKMVFDRIADVAPAWPPCPQITMVRCYPCFAGFAICHSPDHELVTDVRLIHTAGHITQDSTYMTDHNDPMRAYAILRRLRSEKGIIAMVGASAKPDRASYQVMAFLQKAGSGSYR